MSSIRIYYCYIILTKEHRKKACPFLLENSRPLPPPWQPQTPFSSLGTPDFLSTCLGIDSLSRLSSQRLVWGPNSWVFNKLPAHSDVKLGLRTIARFENYKYCLTYITHRDGKTEDQRLFEFHEERFCSFERGFPENLHNHASYHWWLWLFSHLWISSSRKLTSASSCHPDSSLCCLLFYLF